MSNGPFRPDWLREFFAQDPAGLREHIRQVMGHDSILDKATRARTATEQHYTKQEFHYGADFGQPGGDHTAFTRYWVDGDGNMHIEDVRTEEVYFGKHQFPRTMGRSILDECRITLANRPYTCPVRETRHFTMCHDGMRRDKRTQQWQTCEICQGFGLIE